MFESVYKMFKCCPLIKFFSGMFRTLAMHLSRYSSMGIPVRNSTISLLMDVLSFRKNQQHSENTRLILVKLQKKLIL